MGRIFAAILLVAVLVVGGGVIATAAYQAGLNTAVTAASGSGGAVVAPVVVPAYGYGIGFWHPFGWGIFGFLGMLLFVFVVFALIRATFFRGGPGRRGGWGRGWGPGWDAQAQDHGPTGNGPRNGWESRAHGTFDDWHRRAHNGAAAGADPTAWTPIPPSGPSDPSIPA